MVMMQALVGSYPTASPAEADPGGHLYDSAGTYSWTAPSGVTSVAVVCVGPGGGRHDATSLRSSGGGGGGLGYKNNISVVPGTSYTVVVGAAAAVGSGTYGTDSYFKDTSTCVGESGQNAGSESVKGAGGSYVGDGGGNGGLGGTGRYSGGGGAGGYSGAGGTGASTVSSGDDRIGGNGSGGAGGGGGGWFAGSGGGVGVYGEGTSGTGGVGTLNNGNSGGHGGSGGADGASYTTTFSTASKYGGAAGYRVGSLWQSNAAGQGADGAVRILWGNSSLTRTFPTTNVGLSTTYPDGQTESFN